MTLRHIIIKSVLFKTGRQKQTTIILKKQLLLIKLLVKMYYLKPNYVKAFNVEYGIFSPVKMILVMCALRA